MDQTQQDTTPILITEIPPRFAEAAFRRYEPYITHAMHVLPSEFDIHCREVLGLSPETVSARLRDAMRSLKMYNWQTTINMIKFNELYGQIEVARKDVDSGIVVIRMRRGRGVEPKKQLAYIDIPLAGTEHQRRTAIIAAVSLAEVANTTLGQCGLGGLRHPITAEVFRSAYSTEATFVEDGDAIILL